MENGTKEIDCGELKSIPVTDYSGEMSPCKARHVTLQEVIDYCDMGMKSEERESGDERGVILMNPDKYFSYASVKQYCENLQKKIQW